MIYSLGMRFTGSIILSASVIATVAMNAAESRSMDNYRSIVDRNPFGLKPVPPVVTPAPVDTTPTPKMEQFYLTGISTIGYPQRPKKAFLMNKDNTKKDYADKYYNMQINEKQGDLRLDDIDEKGKRVKVTYRGDEMWLSMKENGVPTPTSTTAPQPGMPGIPGMAPAVPNIPGAAGVPTALPGAVPTANNAMQPSVYPSTRRLPRSNQYGNANQTMQGGGSTPVYTPNIPGAPVENQFTQNPGNQNIAPQAQEPLDPALQFINMAAQKLQNERQGQELPPLPPVMTP
jgi:hypothetical protein